MVNKRGNTEEKFLEILWESQGAFISGEQLADRLGVSRAAIWKTTDHLRERGYKITAIQNKGYRLEEIPDVIEPVIMDKYLESTIFHDKIHYLSETSSTNDRLKGMAREGYPEGTVVIADIQTHGKGRLGRNWYSPDEKGLWLSLLLRPQIHPRWAGHFPIICALAAADAVAEFRVAAGVKWPNDLVFDHRKLSGILLEMAAEFERVNFLVAGIGINLNQKEFPSDLKDKAISIAQITGDQIPRYKLAIALLQKTNYYYSLYTRNGFSEIKAKWLQKAVYLHQKVNISLDTAVIEGCMEGISDMGELILLKDGVLTPIHSGDLLPSPGQS